MIRPHALIKSCYRFAMNYHLRSAGARRIRVYRCGRRNVPLSKRGSTYIGLSSGPLGDESADEQYMVRTRRKTADSLTALNSIRLERRIIL